MKANIQSQISPFANQMPASDSTKKASPTETVSSDVGKADFRDLLRNSTEDIVREREIKKNNDGFTGKETEAEFLEKLADKTRPKREIKNTLDKDDFLKLFVTQLKHQDPLNPDDGAEMAAKLAQFNSLEQMMNMNTTLEKLVDAQKVNRSAEFVNYIGKEINIDGGRINLAYDKSVDMPFNLKSDATSAKLEVRDNTGTVLFEKELGTLNAGDHRALWDGKLADGSAAPQGTYSYYVDAKNLNNDSVPVEMKTTAKIKGVDIQDAEGAFYTDFGKVKFSDARAVGDLSSLDKPLKKEEVPAQTVVTDPQQAQGS